MKIYSKTGDNGETSLCGADRIRKDSERLEVCGSIDELSAVLGVVTALDSDGGSLQDDIVAVVERIQAELFEFGAELACHGVAVTGTMRIADRHINALEADIDRFTAGLLPLGEFILPGGNMAAAQLHVARTVCRRAERRLVTLIEDTDEAVSSKLLVYLNRLSDLLFILARSAVAAGGQKDRTIH